MKVVGIVLLIISSCLADEECEKQFKGAKCEYQDCDDPKEIMIMKTHLCTKNHYYCCQPQEDTPCGDRFEGICRSTECTDNELELGSQDGDNIYGCLCPSTEYNRCCVEHKTPDYLCNKLKNGRCMPGDNCIGQRGELSVLVNLCVKHNRGLHCCVFEQACEYEVPNGLCVPRDFCPEGYETPEEQCIDKPEGVYEWCDDSDEICCVERKYK